MLACLLEERVALKAAGRERERNKRERGSNVPQITINKQERERERFIAIPYTQ